MTVFYKNYIALCAKANKSPSAVAEENGLSRTSPNGWKKGKLPRDATIAKLADYFGVSSDALVAEENKTPPAEAAGISKERLEMIEKIKALTPEEFSEKASAIEAILNIKL